MKIIPGPHVTIIKSPEELGGRVAHVVSLSKTLRLAMRFGGEETRKKLEKIGEDIANQFDGDVELALSLKHDPMNGNGNRAMRQIDLKNDAGKIIMKAFVMWHTETQAWHVLLELPHETVWENGEPNI